MQDASLAGATLQDTVFTEAFDATRAVAISSNGTYWAASSRRGNVRVWREGGKRLHLAWQAHTDTVRALAFSPDGGTLATGSWDGAIKLWDIESGALLWTRWHTNNIQRLAFAPDGYTLASGSFDRTVKLWDLQSREHQQTLRRDRPYERLNITGIRGVTEVQKATMRALGAIESAPVPGIQHIP